MRCIRTVFPALILTLLSPVRTAAQTPEKGQEPPPALVEVATVLEQRLVERITLVGTAEPWLETVVASEEAGLVERMLVDEGDRVKEGQLLCEQDASQLKLTILTAKAALDEAEILQAQARREKERQERLFLNNTVAEKAFEDAEFNLEVAIQKVARLRAELDLLEDQLKKKMIRAPVSGSVVKRYALVGQWLGKGAPVVTLAVLHPIRLFVQVPERYIVLMREGDKVQVTFDALPHRTFEGPIAAIIPQADEAARTFPVRVDIPNPHGTIKAGLLGRANLPVGPAYTALLVPKDALVLRGTGVSVYVVNNHTAHHVPVTTGAAHGDLIEVKGELKAGMKVVIRGNERLRPGQRVRIIRGGGPGGEASTS